MILPLPRTGTTGAAGEGLVGEPDHTNHRWGVSIVCHFDLNGDRLGVLCRVWKVLHSARGGVSQPIGSGISVGASVGVGGSVGGIVAVLVGVSELGGENGYII